MSERIETMWCTVCGQRFTDEEIKGWGCPSCGNEGVPCGTTDDVRVEINWHELHILTVWAENWANEICRRPTADRASKQAPDVVTAIARRLQRQHPDMSALTLSEEIADLPHALESAGLACGPIETHGNLPRPKPIPVNGPGAVGHSQAASIEGQVPVAHVDETSKPWR